MSVNSKTLLLAAGLVNIVGVLVFSLGFTNRSLTENSSVMFSQFGLVCIMLWGAAYIAAARAKNIAHLLMVFAIEKSLYFVSWVFWLSENSSRLNEVFSQSVLTGIFYSVYGLIDLVFGLLFALQVYRMTRESSESP